MCKAEEVMDHRRLVQLENEKEYQKALVSIKEKLRDVEGAEMRENMQDQIRQWFIESRLVWKEHFVILHYLSKFILKTKRTAPMNGIFVFAVNFAI